MSKIIIEIETTEDAQRAQRVIAAILGESVSKTITVGEVSISETVAEEPKKEVAKKTTTPKKEVEKKLVTKKEVEPEEDDELGEDTTDEDPIDLATLTTIAKDAVSKSDRATVKDVIGKYGDKLSSVKSSDYAALAEDLKAL